MTCQSALDIANAAGVSPIVGHSFCLSSTAAEIALVPTQRNGEVFRPIESVGPLKVIGDPFEPQLAMDDESVRLSDGHGLGTRLNEDTPAESEV